MTPSEDTTMSDARLEVPDWGEDLFDNSAEFADNPEPRCPCVLILDTSQSMAGEPIAALNRGLHFFRDELLTMPLARKRVEVAVISFGAEVCVVQDFITADRFQPSALQAAGETPMCTAIVHALELVEKRKERYRANGIPYFRPWLLLITDGMPQGDSLETTRQALHRLRAAEESGKLAFFAVGVEGANMKLLGRISISPPLKLVGLRFRELFAWLSMSTARAATGEMMNDVLPPAW